MKTIFVNLTECAEWAKSNSLPTSASKIQTPDGCVTIKQYARMRGVGPTTPYWWIKTGMPTVGNFIYPAIANEWLTKNRAKPPTECVSSAEYARMRGITASAINFRIRRGMPVVFTGAGGTRFVDPAQADEWVAQGNFVPRAVKPFSRINITIGRNPPPGCVTVTEYARMCGLDKDMSVWRWIRQGLPNIDGFIDPKSADEWRVRRRETVQENFRARSKERMSIPEIRAATIATLTSPEAREATRSRNKVRIATPEAKAAASLRMKARMSTPEEKVACKARASLMHTPQARSRAKAKLSTPEAKAAFVARIKAAAERRRTIQRRNSC